MKCDMSSSSKRLPTFHFPSHDAYRVSGFPI
nr:MAG TPA: hypothetical protein [Bacteriophage sp.]